MKCRNPLCSSAKTSRYNSKYCGERCRVKYATWRSQRGAELLDAMLANDGQKLIQLRHQILDEIYSNKLKEPTT